MKALTNILATLLVLAVLAALGWAAYYSIGYLVGVFSGFDTQTKDLMVALWIAVFIGALIIAGSVRWARKREAQDRLRLEKAAVYRQVLDAWASRPDARSGNGTPTSETMLETAERALLLWGSSSVLKHSVAYKAVLAEAGPDASETQAALNVVLRAMRTDLGQSPFGLTKGELAAWFGQTAGAPPRTLPEAEPPVRSMPRRDR